MYTRAATTLLKHACNKGSVRHQCFHSLPTLHDHLNMKVSLIPMLQDNYGYLILDETTNIGAVVDPVEADTVLSVISKAGCEVTQVLTTHHHWDHAGGNKELSEKKPGMQFYGGDERIHAMTDKVKHEQQFQIGNLKVTCFETPCHTTGHICYFVEGEGVSPALFSGDTLFTAGCGKFFEGNGEQMYRNLLEICSALPDDTRVYCGHEYTVGTLQFAKHVEPDNPAVLRMIEESVERRNKGEPTVPTTIAQEKTFNPFMRVHVKSVMDFAGSDDPVQVMGILRDMKDKFKG